MYTRLLNDNWLLRRLDADPGEAVPSQVPGSVFYDLLKAGKTEDPFYRDNELDALRLMDADYVFTRKFDVPAECFNCSNLKLRFDGIDTVADVYLNGVHLGNANNMHRIWEYDIRAAVRREDNDLTVIIHSPTVYIRKAYEADPVEGAEDAMKGFPHLRKAHCMFGWDWGPRLPDMGIWRDVTLLAYDTARIEDVYIRQEHTPGRVVLHIDVDIESFVKADDESCGNTVESRGNTILEPCGDAANESCEANFTLSALLTDPEGINRTVPAEELTAGIVINDPKLWWPNGYGKQPLYTVAVRLMQGETCLDTWTRRIGLRTLTVHIEKDTWGEQFCHEVNGVRIFAMGADYIPEDNLLPRITPERTRDLLRQAKEANYNCIRVWGGGHYPGDAFWDACDELGLIVWEDFMFACAVYHLTKEIEDNIRAELSDNIRRIRHHASLGLWCGNNEMEKFVKEGMWVTRPSERSDYVKMYEYIFPGILEKLDPDTFYWPASPSSGGSFDDPDDENRGDAHYWDVWHGNKPIAEYRRHYFRYLSEFGFQSFPALKTCETFTLPGERNIFSYVMEKHQRNAIANGKIMNYMGQTFLYPSGFDTVIYASQLLQGEAVRSAIEHCRRNRGRCMGTIVWQLNDCWPVASWSSIDFYGRWKALHYMEKRAFAPLLLSCEEEGMLTWDTNPNAQPHEGKQSFRLNISSEMLTDVAVSVSWELRDHAGEILREGKIDDVHVPALSAVWLDEVDCTDADPFRHYVSYACSYDGQTVSEGTVLFTAPKYFQFLDPELSVERKGNEIIVSARAYARNVEILNKDEDLILSDNYFDLNAQKRTLRILRGSPEGLRARSVYDIR